MLMHDECMTVLADIGGTYVRFAVLDAGTPTQIEKFKAVDFETLQNALETYCSNQNLQAGGKLRIATAGYEDEGVWKFVNQNKWVIDPNDLKDAGWTLENILNDFEAGGMFAAGCANKPVDVVSSNQNATGMALKAIQTLVKR